MKHIYTSFFVVAFLLLSAKAYSQVTVSSSDSITCTNLCTTLTAHVIGDTPIVPDVHPDDQWATLVIPIGFTFTFYGNNYTKCLMGDNGNITFDTTLAGAYDPYSIDGPLASGTLTAPDPGHLDNTIDGPWCDIYLPDGGDVTYSTDGIEPFRKFVATWCHCQMYTSGICDSQWITTQIIIYETTNIVETHISHKTICTSWNGGYAEVGVKNSAGTASTVAPGRDYPTDWTGIDEAWRFTPATGGSSYTVASIPYAPVPYTASSIYWYNAATGAYLGTGPTLTVCPTVTTTYKAGALGCADTSFGYYTVNVEAAFIAGIASSTNPSHCGACDGIIVLNGFTPGTIDTINYSFGGAPQPTVIATASTGGTITLTGLCAGAYTNIIAKQANCVSAPLTTTLVNPSISISGLTPSPVSICGASDGSIVLSGLYPDQSFTFNFTLNGIAQPPVTGVSTSAGTFTLSGLTVGVYANIIASFGACTTPAAGPTTVGGPPPPTIFMTAFTSPTQCGYCDGSITIHYIGPYESDTVFYRLNGVAQPSFLNIALPDGTVFIPGLCAGDYDSFTVKVGPCPSVVVGEAFLTNPTILDSFKYENHFGCKGDTVMFTNRSSASGPLYYIWNFGDSVTDTSTNPMHIYAQGVYTITLTADDHVCDTTFTLTDSLIHPLHAGFVDTPFIYCQNSPVTLTNTTAVLPGGPLTYEWLFGDGSTDTATNTVHVYPKTGVYNVQLVATNFVPCNDTSSVKVYIDSSSAISLKVTDSVLCRSSSVTFTGTYSNIGNVGITWNFGDGDSITNLNPVTHSFEGTGTYTVTATARYRKCADTSVSKQLAIYPGPSIYLGPDTSICIGSEAITLADVQNAPNKDATWAWNTGQTTSSITVVEPGYYAATVDINGCYATDTVWVTNDCYVNIPNVFTPNGDGLNDYFYPLQYLAKGLISFKMDIYNRWGQLLFEGTALDGRGWDGKFNGVDQLEGVYVYVMDAVFKDGQKQHHRGNVTLLR